MAMAEYTHARFVADLRALGITKGKMATALNVSGQAVYQWGVTAGIPYWVPILMAAWKENKALRERLDPPPVDTEPPKRKRRKSL